MIKVGKQVCMLAPSEGNARNGEGAFIRLRDGRVMFAYSRYLSNDGGDDATAEIAVTYSCDEGETWSQPGSAWGGLDSGTANNMCVSLIRKNDGAIAIYYLHKYVAPDGLMKSRVVERVSYDEGRTWSDFRIIIDAANYLVKENDRVVRLKSGRLLLPLNYHGSTSKRFESGVTWFFYSDDDGLMWTDTKTRLYVPNVNGGAGMQETGVMQRADGSVWSFTRTELGCQYESVSYDDGITWTLPTPNVKLTSPLSPMSAKNIGNGYSCVVLNPIPNCFAFPNGVGVPSDAKTSTWGRTPLVIGISNDGNKTFTKTFYVEDDLCNGYCYTGIFDGGDYILLSYYHSNDGPCPLNSNKIVKITYDELGIN